MELEKIMNSSDAVSWSVACYSRTSWLGIHKQHLLAWFPGSCPAFCHILYKSMLQKAGEEPGNKT